MRSHAKQLRQNLTKAERMIWYSVKADRLLGASFKRQVPIGPYIADFVSHRANLVIEIDGGQHYEAMHERRDQQRDKFFRGKGYAVLRFSNLDVLTNREGVLQTIASQIQQANAPSLPSPASGGGGACGNEGFQQ